MTDCGKCDGCVFRATGVMPEPTYFGALKMNTDCRIERITNSPGSYILTMRPEDFMEDAGAIDMDRAQRDPAYRHRIERLASLSCGPVGAFHETEQRNGHGHSALTENGQRVIRLGQSLMAEDTPIGGYVINLSMADMASKHVREELFDYLQTVAIRFGLRQPIIDIRIRSNR